MEGIELVCFLFLSISPLGSFIFTSFPGCQQNRKQLAIWCVQTRHQKPPKSDHFSLVVSKLWSVGQMQPLSGPWVMLIRGAICPSDTNNGMLFLSLTPMRWCYSFHWHQWWGPILPIDTNDGEPVPPLMTFMGQYSSFYWWQAYNFFFLPLTAQPEALFNDHSLAPPLKSKGQ